MRLVVQRPGLRVLAALLGLLAVGSAEAHSWYPFWCCNDDDCRPLSEEMGETVSETPDGWLLWDGRLAARGSVRLSPDRHYHLCEEPRTKAIICFFAPLGGS
jgi:hypothetical protein